MLAAISRGGATDYRLCLGSNRIGVGNRRAIAQPYIDVGEVLDIFGEERAAQMLADQNAAREKKKRACDERFAMFECVMAELVVKPVTPCVRRYSIGGSGLPGRIR